MILLRPDPADHASREALRAAVKPGAVIWCARGMDPRDRVFARVLRVWHHDGHAGHVRGVWLWPGDLRTVKVTWPGGRTRKLRVGGEWGIAGVMVEGERTP